MNISRALHGNLLNFRKGTRVQHEKSLAPSGTLCRPSTCAILLVPFIGRQCQTGKTGRQRRCHSQATGQTRVFGAAKPCQSRGNQAAGRYGKKAYLVCPTESAGSFAPTNRECARRQDAISLGRPNGTRTFKPSIPHEPTRLACPCCQTTVVSGRKARRYQPRGDPVSAPPLRISEKRRRARARDNQARGQAGQSARAAQTDGPSARGSTLGPGDPGACPAS